MATEATLEILNDAHVAFIFDDSARNSGRLFDACLNAGMDRDEADHEAWAGERITEWLTTGESDDDAEIFCLQCDDTPNNGEKLCGSCLAEHRAELAMMEG